MKIVIALLALGSLFAAAQAAPAADFNTLVEQFFDGYFQINPSQGTGSGFHQYDKQLEDYSQKGIEHETAFWREYRDKFAHVDTAKLTPEALGDLSLVRATIDGALLEIENIRMWQRNPDRYSSGVTGSVFVIMSRNYAPQDERLKSVTARERQMPAVFQAARQNLKDVPRVYADVTLEQLPGIISFFQNDVPKAFDKVHDPKLLADFKQTNASVIDSLKQYQDFLKGTILPSAKGDFRIGPDNYRKKLLFEEMVDIPLDRLLEIGQADLNRNQAEFRRIAALIDSTKTPQQILEQAQKDHPTAEQLIPTFRAELAGLKSFIEKNKIVTIPSEVPPIVEETPPFARALSSASMDTPGPYEKVAKEAYFNVTLPDPSWPAEQKESWLQGFNRGVINSTATHEVYPGHYTQFLWVPSAPSKIRKLLGSGTNAEGWAHYTEQMMLDEGFGRTPGIPEEKDSKYLMLRLGQLQDALLRNARYIVGLKMHTGQMSFEDGVKFFREQGYQTAAVSERETRRGTSDPTYLMYTLGKLQILKLREDYRKKMGDRFSLQQFHNQFLKEGFPPVKIIRREMLGDDSPTL